MSTTTLGPRAYRHARVEKTKNASRRVHRARCGRHRAILEDASAMGASREDDALARRMGKISEKSVNVVVVERPEAREALARTCLRAMLRERGAFDRVATFEDGTCARVERDDARDAFCLRETLLERGGDAVEEEEAAVEALSEDIACVVRAFASVVPRREGEGVKATLSLLRSTLCSRLHVDVTSARLMVTYCGASTEICDETTSAVIAAANAGGGNVFSDALKGAAERLAPPRECGECAVALLKGERWRYDDGTTSRGRAIVHRSPAIDERATEPDDRWRLTLKLDVERFGEE